MSVAVIQLFLNIFIFVFSQSGPHSCDDHVSTENGEGESDETRHHQPGRSGRKVGPEIYPIESEKNYDFTEIIQGGSRITHWGKLSLGRGAAPTQVFLAKMYPCQKK